MNPQDPILPSTPPSAPPRPRRLRRRPWKTPVRKRWPKPCAAAFSLSRSSWSGWFGLPWLGLFTVGPQEKAVILRLGKPVGEGERALLNPGLHWAFPRPIDEVEHIPITSLQMAESSVGWYLTPAERANGSRPVPRRQFAQSRHHHLRLDRRHQHHPCRGHR